MAVNQVAAWEYLTKRYPEIYKTPICNCQHHALVIISRSLTVVYSCAGCHGAHTVNIPLHMTSVVEGSWNTAKLIARPVASVDKLDIGNYVLSENNLYIRCFGCLNLLRVDGQFKMLNGRVHPYHDTAAQTTMCTKCPECAAEHWYCYDGISERQLELLNLEDNRIRAEKNNLLWA